MAIQVALGHDITTTVLHLYNSLTGSGGAAIGAFGRNSTNGLRLTSLGSNTAANRLQTASKTFPTALATSHVGFAVKLSAIPTAGNPMPVFGLANAGQVQVRLQVLADATCRIINGSGTVLGILDSFSFLTGVFYHFEIKTFINSTTGTVQVWVNEVSRKSLTNVNTVGAATGSTQSTQAILEIDSPTNQGITFNWDYDDLVIADAQIGDVEVREDLPTGTGATDQWAATGAATTREAVDETPPDDDTSYASEDTAGHISLWTYASIPTTATVKAMGISPRAKKTDAGTCTIRAVYRNSAGPTNHEGADKAPSDSSYEYHPHFFDVNPATSNPFTASEINSGEYGVKRQT